MILSQQDAKLYFELLGPLQFFANQKLQVVPDVPSLDAYQNQSGEEKFNIREALFKTPELFDEYADANPFQISAENLQIVRKWKNFVLGEFYIERHLKKYTVFIKKDTVYGVIGLQDELEELIPKRYLPTYVRAVLLPFKDKVIYDGLLQSYNMYFGGNIKANLREIYLRAKQREEIITSFGPKKEQEVIALQDWKPNLAALIKEAKKLHGGAGQPAIHSPLFNLVKASLQLTLTGVTEPDNSDKLHVELKKVKRALVRIENTINRM